MLQYPVIPPLEKYSEQLLQIEVLSKALAAVPVNKPHQLHIFHQQVLKSSLFSARIEGNQLTLAEAPMLEHADGDRSKLEITNVMDVLEKLNQFDQPFSADLLKIFHARIMRGLHTQAGKLRMEASAIFDQYGAVVYLTPEPGEMKQMLALLDAKIGEMGSHSWQTQLLEIVAAHYYFEKTHPFVDGNGRTGRVLVQWLLRRTGQFDEYILPVDQFFENKRRRYYDLLEKNSTTIEGFVEFFLEAMIWSLESVLSDIRDSGDFQPKTEFSLLPRRQEILAIITDHPYISLETIQRRFPRLPKRTVAYDVQQLIKQKLVRKYGQTRGAVYSVSSLES